MVIAVQLDAFRWDYAASSVGFLKRLSDNGVSGQLSPTFGFEPDFAYFAGLYPDEANSGAQFIRDPSGSPFRGLKGMPRALDLLPTLPEKVFRRLLGRLLRGRSDSPVFTTARIPFQLLHHFSLSLTAPLDQEASGSPCTVFDLLRAQGKTWLYHGEPRHRVDIDSVVRRIESDLSPADDLVYLHVGDLDYAGHKFGPDSSERIASLHRVEAGLEKIDRLANERADRVRWLVFGDHGMAQVNATIDVQAVVSALPLKLESDYLLFLDSTMARFWFFNARARDLILEAVSKIPSGHLLTRDELDHYHLNFADNRFGDAFFVADSGTLVSPNFYQRNDKIKGMHGYLPESPDQRSGFIVGGEVGSKGRRIVAPQDIRRIFPTLLELLGITPPEKLGLRSLLSESDHGGSLAK